MYIKRDPGPCPVDDAPHTTCVSPDYTGLTIVQLPNRDGFTPPPLVSEVRVPSVLVGQVIQKTLPPGQFTTAGYGQMTKRHLKDRKRR